jgi:outer membrane receptor protein involved in Fe transport
MISFRSGLAASSAAFALMAAAPVFAQETPSSGVVANADNGQTAGKLGDDIVVTAQKREQTLIDVPQSISVLSGATLETQQANSFQDYLKLVPGLQLEQGTAGFGRLVLRGINTGGVGSTVGVYVDDTPFGSSSSLVNGALLAGDFDTFDVARVEVLRGPQGTLYGASSMGGILKFVTSEPDTQHLEGKVRGGVETTDGGALSYYGNAMINIPLGDTLAFRASGTYRRNGGFIDSIGLTATDAFGTSFTTRRDENLNSSRTYGGRASLLFKPSDAFSIKLSAILQNIENDGANTIDTDPATMQPLYGGLTQSEFQPSTSTISYRVYNGLINWNLGFATLTSSTSYAKLSQRFHTDATFNLSGDLEAVFDTPNELYLNQLTSVKKFTQEVRLASAPNDVFEWLVGGYYTHETGVIDQAYIPVVPGTETQITTFPLLAALEEDSTYDEVAGFANGTLHLGSRFDIDLGGRFSHNHQDATQTQDGALVGGAAVYPRATSSDNVFTYSVAPKFKISQNASLYARVARGFRPGGPNILPPNPPANVPTTFKSDSLTSYEVGFKAETSDRTFGIDVAVYHIDWNRIQLFAEVNNFGINVNGTSATSDGAEFTATFRPTAGLDLSVNGAFTHAHLNGDTDPLIGGVKGDELPFTPKVSMGVDGDYRWAVGGHTQAFLGGSLRFLSKQSGEFDPAYVAVYGHQVTIPSYEVVDARAGLDFGRFSIEVYAKNLNNALGITSTNALTANGLPVVPNGAMSAGIIRPRTVGVSVTADF